MKATTRDRLRRFCAAIATAGMLAASISAARPAETSELEARRAAVVFQMAEIQEQAKVSKERLAELEKEIASIDKDRTSLTAALIQTAKTEKKLAQEVEDIEERMVGLVGEERELRKSLMARRGTLAEVLGALQRMGRNPPPALLVRPADALASVRSAIVLGAVVPQMRSETDRLLTDLQSLSRVVETAKQERDKLAGVMTSQEEEKARVTALLEEKAALQDQAKAQTQELKRQTDELAKKSKDVGSLIESIEKEIEDVRLAALEAERAEETRLRESRERAEKLTPQENRLAAALPFTALRGKLQLPAVGRFAARYGDRDSTGHNLNGDTLATQSGAIVTAPADGRVLFAGSFRGYGQLLIIDAGEQYHLVMAGMDKLNVSQGQSVLSGEPVGVMGESRIASTAFDGNADGQPLLYVEFRKDKRPVDPGPWWSRASSGRANNDS